MFHSSPYIVWFVRKKKIEIVLKKVRFINRISSSDRHMSELRFNWQFGFVKSDDVPFAVCRKKGVEGSLSFRWVCVNFN